MRRGSSFSSLFYENEFPSHKLAQTNSRRLPMALAEARPTPGLSTVSMPLAASSDSWTVTISLWTGVLACIAIIFIGLRFLVRPDLGAQGFGVHPTDTRAFTAVKGVRDIASGLVYLTIWRVAGRQIFGWTMLASAVTPLGDMLIVLNRGGPAGMAFGVHGVTAAVLVVIGRILSKS